MDEFNNEGAITLPESIVLGGVTYNISQTPELRGLINTVGQIERRKLYSSMESIKKSVESLKKVNVTASTAPFDASELAGQLKPYILEVVKEAVQPITNYAQTAQQETLEQYLANVLRENDGNCIPELVKGNSKEEILASLEESKALFQKYHPAANVRVTDPAIEKQAADAGVVLHNPDIDTRTRPVSQPVQQPTPQAAPKPAQQAPVQPVQDVTIPGISASMDAQVDPITQVRTMSESEYAKQREQLLKQLEQQFPNLDKL